MLPDTLTSRQIDALSALGISCPLQIAIVANIWTRSRASRGTGYITLAEHRAYMLPVRIVCALTASSTPGADKAAADLLKAGHVYTACLGRSKNAAGEDEETTDVCLSGVVYAALSRAAAEVAR